MWYYYTLAAVLITEHVGRKFGSPRPSRLLRAVLNAFQPAVEWLAIRWADAMCFLALIDLPDLWIDVVSILRPLAGLVCLPVTFGQAIDKRVLAMRRPKTYLWGCALVVFLMCAHFVFSDTSLLIAADAIVVLLATYNTYSEKKFTEETRAYEE